MPGECEKCINDSRIQRLESDLDRNSNQHREFYDKLAAIAVREGISENNMQQLIASMHEIQSDLREIKEAPAQSFNAVKMCVITTITSSVVGALIASVMAMIIK